MGKKRKHDGQAENMSKRNKYPGLPGGGQDARGVGSGKGARGQAAKGAGRNGQGVIDPWTGTRLAFPEAAAVAGVGASKYRCPECNEAFATWAPCKQHLKNKCGNANAAVISRKIPADQKQWMSICSKHATETSGIGDEAIAPRSPPEEAELVRFINDFLAAGQAPQFVLTAIRNRWGHGGFSKFGYGTFQAFTAKHNLMNEHTPKPHSASSSLVSARSEVQHSSDVLDLQPWQLEALQAAYAESMRGQQEPFSRAIAFGKFIAALKRRAHCGKQQALAWLQDRLSEEEEELIRSKEYRDDGEYSPDDKRKEHITNLISCIANGREVEGDEASEDACPATDEEESPGCQEP